MPLIDIVIVPYRTLNFARKFGFTVRDLMILQVLQEHPSVASITWLERPTLPIERILSPQKKIKFPKKTEVKERISWNIFPSTLTETTVAENGNENTQWVYSRLE